MSRAPTSVHIGLVACLGLTTESGRCLSDIYAKIVDKISHDEAIIADGLTWLCDILTDNSDIYSGTTLICKWYLRYRKIIYLTIDIEDENVLAIISVNNVLD